ncbi:hypothetical protein KPH14_002478 [Odynerus spinipes]|uniref:C2H2-type domain-containing protein n=1 Tax=Odynerus spinipes TaxID=1348599 RepID=A0AAD9VSV9_9HYME|nr:hypothetical protein KPH14_002478 [Odynerus spinipes]
MATRGGFKIHEYFCYLQKRSKLNVSCVEKVLIPDAPAETPPVCISPVINDPLPIYQCQYCKTTYLKDVLYGQAPGTFANPIGKPRSSNHRARRDLSVSLTNSKEDSFASINPRRRSEAVAGNRRSPGAVKRKGIGRKNFHCPRCNRGYCRLPNMKTHYQFNCGKEPRYQCPYCMKRTKFSSNMIELSRVHGGASKDLCPGYPLVTLYRDNHANIVNCNDEWVGNGDGPQSQVPLFQLQKRFQSQGHISNARRHVRKCHPGREVYTVDLCQVQQPDHQQLDHQQLDYQQSDHQQQSDI